MHDIHYKNAIVLRFTTEPPNFCRTFPACLIFVRRLRCLLDIACILVLPCRCRQDTWACVLFVQVIAFLTGPDGAGQLCNHDETLLLVLCTKQVCERSRIWGYVWHRACSEVDDGCFSLVGDWFFCAVTCIVVGVPLLVVLLKLRASSNTPGDKGPV